ncbi:NADH-ubiquinone oxidoreductase subunit, mitochondrial [Vanrija pseudolonga]|uniref:NADH-ubiquinone oxidoreductase subunit, mitochondrial n=1 Tax=Vanrija pseudolonga TaxID=143232 RepID=A0AAF1BIZ1_9TREE|nr:NADH-ubiquinone oxidoreductase subunit, mitochondrial [Vanrija pseudolonga]
MASVRFAPVLRSKAASRVPRIATRSAHDLTIVNQPKTNRAQPIIKQGPPTGGRSATSGHTVTVFGATGFLGRYIVAKLAKEGSQVIVPYRDEDDKRHLKVTGDLGQVVPLEWDARNPDQIHEAVRHSDTVYNLVGRDWQTRNFSYDDVNVKAAGLIAEVSAASGVDQLIHVSHLNANPNSPSEFYRSKYAGERAVRDAFPTATIVRPGYMYGPEDWLLNAAAQWPILFKLNGGNTKILPVHALDVAQALKVILDAPVTSVASTFNLPGPAVHTYNTILALIQALTLKGEVSDPTVPKALAKAFAGITNKALWWPTVSPDEIERRYIDDAGVEKFFAPDTSKIPSGWVPEEGYTGVPAVDGEPIKSWADLQIEPDFIEEHAIKYVRRYRAAATFDSPVELGHFKAPKPYHVVP